MNKILLIFLVISCSKLDSKGEFNIKSSATYTAEQMCLGQTIHDSKGNIIQGTKDCTEEKSDEFKASSIKYCSTDGEIDCITTTEYPAAKVANLKSSDLKSGVSIAGIRGELDLSNLTPQNIKKDVSIAGVSGNYPSSQFPLDQADDTADLDSFSFSEKIKSPAFFEWFDSTGARHTMSGNSNIKSGLIIPNIEIFGTMGSYTPLNVTLSLVRSNLKFALSWATNGVGVILIKSESPINWQPTNGKQYNVEDLDSSQKIIYIGDQSYEDTSIIPETTYYYKAFSYNADYAYSEASNEISDIATDKEVCGSVGNSCYTNTLAMIAREAITPTNKHIELIDNGLGIMVWKEIGGTKILKPNGMDGWLKNLARNGKSFLDTYFTDYASFEGRKCPPSVYVNDNNKFSENNCIFYKIGTDAVRLSQYNTGIVGEDYLMGWTGDAKWFTGNIKPCADQGMRLPTTYETNRGFASEYYPQTDGSPIFTTTDGISSGVLWGWTATGNTSYKGYYLRTDGFTNYNNDGYAVCVIH